MLSVQKKIYAYRQKGCLWCSVICSTFSISNAIYLMSTKSYVFKPVDNTLLPVMFDLTITISTVPILHTYKALHLVFRKIYAYRQKRCLWCLVICSTFSISNAIYLMSTESCVFKPDANTLLPLMFDPKITIRTVPILQTCALATRSGMELPGKEWSRVFALKT